MVDKPHSSPTPPPAAGAPAAHRGAGPGRRGNDMRDTVAELAERAQLISQEAGTKVAAAMKDVISAGAGIAGFAIESARDLVNYMVRRGQMTPEEADSLIRDAEAAHQRRPVSERERPTASKVAAEKAATAKAESAARAAAAAAAAPPFRGPRPIVPPAGAAPASNGANSKPVVPTKSAAPLKSAPKPAAKAPANTAAQPAAKPATKPAAKAPAKGPSKAPAKAPPKVAAKAPAKASKTSKPAPASKTAKKGKR